MNLRLRFISNSNSIPSAGPWQETVLGIVAGRECHGQEKPRQPLVGVFRFFHPREWPRRWGFVLGPPAFSSQQARVRRPNYAPGVTLHVTEANSGTYQR